MTINLTFPNQGVLYSRGMSRKGVKSSLELVHFPQYSTADSGLEKLYALSGTTGRGRYMVKSNTGIRGIRGLSMGNLKSRVHWMPGRKYKQN